MARFARAAVKRGVVSACRRVGLDVRTLRSVPFGEDWCQDIAYYADPDKIEVIVDVGANVGQTARKLAGWFPVATIYSFEPVPATHELLVSHTADLGRVRAIRAALGEHVCTAPITTQFDGQNTLLLHTKTQTTTQTVSIQIDTLDRFCQNNSIEHIDILKIDTEGFEMSVLRGAAGAIELCGFDFIELECDFVRRPNEPHGDFREIFDYLTPLGYRVVSFYTGGVDDLGWIWGDVLFRRVREQLPGHASCTPTDRRDKRR